MSRECSRLLSCPFFQKYKELGVEEIDRLKDLYCKGPYMDQCVRKMYKELHGSDAPPQMSPEGKVLQENDVEIPCHCDEVGFKRIAG